METDDMKMAGSDKSRKITSPRPAYMSNDQFAAYLADLRNNRLSRPGGARPLLTKASETQTKERPRAHEPPNGPFQRGHFSIPSADVSTGTGGTTPAQSMASGRSMASTPRDYYHSTPTTAPLKPSEVVPTARYMERGQRWMEKEEVVSLRAAMDDIGEQDDLRIHAQAQREASGLIFDHQQGFLPGQDGAYRYRPHLRKNSYAHARTASISGQSVEIAVTGLARDVSRSSSGSSVQSIASSSRGQPLLCSSGSGNIPDSTSAPIASTSKKAYGRMGPRPCPATSGRRKSSLKRNISGEIDHPFSGDQVYEEAGERPTRPSVISSDDGISPTVHVGNMAPRLAESHGTHNAPRQPLSMVDIHKNPVTQSRNPSYRTNGASTADSYGRPGGGADVKEIRGSEIRDATSRRLKDRSPLLPTPSAVSNNHSRPIVSFDKSWQPASSNDAGSLQATPQVSAVGKSLVSAIAVEEAPDTSPGVSGQAGANSSTEVPSIAIIDTAATTGEPGAEVIPSFPSARPLPDPVEGGKKKGHRASRPFGHQSPAQEGARRSAGCHECGLPIAGRFVSLAGINERFHPKCFSCYACGTGLEALEISPEPESSRSERLSRIRRRASGEILAEEPGRTMAEDGDERLRFYCHLDWHELFAPKCDHCKTPIIGEHVVALGRRWHQGHFFCAECGDPFEKGMTHLEKDGYAYCERCQEKLTGWRAPKCRMCKKPVVGEYVVALGGEWHGQCFRCSSCNGGFEDGQIFPRQSADGSLAICTSCRARELKV